jgi:uncharacterized Zn-binding protein involved in type VI secretion
MRIACLSDVSDHGGTIVTSNQDNRAEVRMFPIAVHGCMHDCPIPGHGVTPVAAITTRETINGKLIVTEGAIAGCGAMMLPIDRQVYVE